LSGHGREHQVKAAACVYQCVFKLSRIWNLLLPHV